MRLTLEREWVLCSSVFVENNEKKYKFRLSLDDAVSKNCL